MGEDYISGLANNRIFMKDNFKKAKEMEEGRFGGQMVAGIRVSSEMEYKVDMGFYIEKEAIKNIKDHGTMVCLTVKALSISRMEKDMKGLSNKINFMGRVFFIKMTRLFMEFGRITNYLSSIW